MEQKNVYSLLATPPAKFIVATVVVFVWDTFCMVSDVPPLDAVAKVWPLVTVVSVVYSVDYTDQATLLIVADPKNLDQSTL